MKIKRLLKSVVSLVLVATICMCMTIMGVNAVPEDSSSDYSKRATAMIDFFHNNNSVSAKDISADEFRVFGVFLSNFVLPMNTDLTKIDDTIEKGNGITEDHNTWELFCDAFGKGKEKDKEPLVTLKKTYITIMNEVKEDLETYKLYYEKSKDEWVVASREDVLNWDSLAGDGIKLCRKIDNKYIPVFDTGTEIGKAAFMLSIGSVIGSPGLSDADSDAKNQILLVTPFGDIVYTNKDTTDYLKVIVPACLNPYTFSSKGDKLYLNNSFATGSLVSSDNVKNLRVDDKDDTKKNHFITDFYKDCGDENGIGDFTKGGIYSSSFYSPAGTNNIRSGLGIHYKNGEYMSGWSINDLRTLFINKSGSKIAVVNVDKGVRYTADKVGDLEKATKPYGSNTDFIIKGRDIEFTSMANEGFDSYITIFTNIWSAGDAGSAKWWKALTLGNRKDTWKYNALTVFQIPLEQTVSKVAVFSEEGFTNNEWASSSVVKDSCLFSEDTESSLSSLYDPQNEYKAEGAKVIAERMICVDDAIVRILNKGAKRYVQNSNPISTETNLWAGIYWAYLEDLVGLQIDGSEITFNGTKPKFDWLPELKVTGFSSSIEYLAQNSGTETDSVEESEKQKSIISWTYDILNTDSVNNSTRVNWLKSIIDGLFLGMHNAMVGVDIAGTITSVGNANSSGVYHSVMGYVTTPTFSEMPITNWIMDNYVLVYIILMLIVAVLLVVMVMSKTRRLGAAVFTFVMMLLLLLLPAELLNGGILFSNKIAEDVFSGKFTYWAIVQHAQYVNNKNSVEESSESVADTAVDNVISSAVDNVTASQQLGDSGITVKWLAPKKYGLTEKIQQQAKDANSNLQLFTYFTEQLFKGETYSADENSTFLYRTYYSLYTSAASGHNAITDKKILNASKSIAKNSDLSAVIRSSWYGSNSVSTRKNWSDEQKTNFITKHIAFTNENMSNKGGAVDKKVTADGLGMILRAITGGTHTNSADKSDYTFPSGYSSGYFGADLMKPLRNNYVNTNRISVILTDSTLNDAVLNFVNEGTYSKGLDLGTKANATVSENVENFKTVSEGVNEFLLYTESPYYYFYNVFSDVLVDNGATRGSSNFVKVLLDEGFFKVNDEDSASYGEFKDYLDLEGLFTYIIPYLNYANSDVKQYESTFGMTVDRSQCKDEADYIRRCNNLQNVWNLYSPWVDALYEVNSSSQRAQSGYNTISIDDPLNPASYYYKGRPMAFSQADAKMRGYAESDLTDVEYKLQKVLKNTYDDMIELLNYKDLATMENGSDILISAAAMMATFNFNQEFSDTSFLSNGVTLYPLGFEMRNMNYDAFLRLIIANSTYTLSSSTMDSTGLYSNLIHNTSFITALLLILVDIVAVYIIPALKILLMVAMLALGLFMSISCALSKPDKLAKTVCTSFVIPFLSTIGVFILHTLLIALFMGNGVTGVIEYKSLSLSTGDPTITLLLLLVVDVVTSLLLLKLFKKVGKDLIKYIKMTFEFAKGITIGAAGAAVAGVIGTVKGAVHYGVGVPANHIAAKVSRHKDAKANANANQRASGKSSGNGGKANSGNGGSTPKPTQQTSQQKAQNAQQSQNKQQQGSGSQNGKTGGSNSNKSNNVGKKTAKMVNRSNTGSSGSSGTADKSKNKSSNNRNRDIKISSANKVIKNANSSSNSFSNKYYKVKRSKSSSGNENKSNRGGKK